MIPVITYAPTLVAYAPTLIAAGAAIRKTVDTVAWVHGWYVWTQMPAPDDEDDAWQWVEPAASTGDSGDDACDPDDAYSAFELASL